MIDPFVFVAPIVLLLVVALLQFVGCSFQHGVAPSAVAAPTFAPTPKTYGVAQSVTMSSEAGSVIYYRTDGQDPVPPPNTTVPPDPPTQTYGGPIPVSTTTTIKAIALRPNGDKSTVATGQYIIIPIAEVLGQRARGRVDNAVAATATFPNLVTEGNLVVVAGVVYRGNGGTTITAVQDALGTEYTPLQFVSTSNGDYRLFIAYGRAPKAGPNSVTVTTAAAAYMSFGIDEFSGIDDAILLDTDGGGLSGGPSPTPTAFLTPTIANALIVGTVTFEPFVAATITPGAGYTQIAEEEDNSLHIDFNAEFKVVTTMQVHTVNWTLSSSHPWSLYRVSFRGWPTTT